MTRYRISLDSSVYINAENEQAAIEKYDTIFKQFDAILENAEDNVEFIKYIININEE